MHIKLSTNESFSRVIRWGAKPIVYAPITGIAQAAPVVFTAVGHGLVDGWRAAPVSVVGMKQINAKDSPPSDDDYHQVTVIDVDHVSMNDIDASLFSAYTSGGYLRYLTPMDLTGYTARMQIKDKVGGTVLLLLETNPAPGGGVGNGRIVIDNTAKTITLTVAEADVAAAGFTVMRGVTDLIMVPAVGNAKNILPGEEVLIERGITSLT